MAASLALEAAFALARNPVLAPVMREQPLPSGVDIVMKIVAREAGALTDVLDRTHLERAFVVMAVELYVQQVLLFPGAPPHRVLGVEPGATRQQMRTHMRWLLLWLHPDHSHPGWRTAFAGRVIDAWRDVSRQPGLQPALTAHPDRPSPPPSRARATRPTRWLAQPVPIRLHVNPRARRVKRLRLGVALVATMAGIVGVAWIARDDAAAFAAVFAWMATTFNEADE